MFHNSDVAPSERNDLLLKKIAQCKVLFDFSDPLSDMKGKEIKRQTLTELVEYVGTSRGAISEPAHLELINMVTELTHFPIGRRIALTRSRMCRLPPTFSGLSRPD